MDIDARAFGQLEGEVKALTVTLAEQNRVLESQNIKMDLMAQQQNAKLEALSLQISAISSTLSEARGGWKTLAWLAGISATGATVVTWALQHLIFRPGP